MAMIIETDWARAHSPLNFMEIIAYIIMTMAVMMIKV